MLRGFVTAAACYAAWVAGAAQPATAATQCVNPEGTAGCFSSIGAAVAAASPNDTITVAKGTYSEDVVIGKALSLIGAGEDETVIDATGLANGIHIDGYEHPGLSHVVATGFSVRNANFQGILVTNASFVTVANNRVTGNDVALQPFASGGPSCTGLKSFLGGIFTAGEGFDCGEGIHLSAVDHSTVANNEVEHNAGGILLSDDTGANHDNLISGNSVRNNPYDCGITIASHHFALHPVEPTVGVYHNTVSGNTSSANGLSTGEGAGVGIFAGPPGGQNWGNVIINNELTGNALPGVAMHSHGPFQNLNDNLIVGNRISGNGPDGDPGTTVPTGIDVFADEAVGHAAPITGTVISQNVFKDEGIDIAVKTSGGVDAHFNNFFDATGLDNLGAGFINATENWWKCSAGPGAPGCGEVAGSGVQVTPFLSQPFSGGDN